MLNWPNDWAVLWVLISTVHFILYYYHVRYTFHNGSLFTSCLKNQGIPTQNRHDTWTVSVYNGTGTHNRLVGKWKHNHLENFTKWLSCVLSTYLCGTFDCMFLSCHVRDCTLSSCLNVKKLLAQSRRDISNLIDCNGSRNHKHLVCKQTLHHLVKLAKRLSYFLGTYLHGALDCMLFSCRGHVSERVLIL